MLDKPNMTVTIDASKSNKSQELIDIMKDMAVIDNKGKNRVQCSL